MVSVNAPKEKNRSQKCHQMSISLRKQTRLFEQLHLTRPFCTHDMTRRKKVRILLHNCVRLRFVTRSNNGHPDSAGMLPCREYGSIFIEQVCGRTQLWKKTFLEAAKATPGQSFTDHEWWFLFLFCAILTSVPNTTRNPHRSVEAA